MKTIKGHKITGLARGWFFDGPSAIYLNPEKLKDFDYEFNLAGSGPERRNKRNRTDYWARIGRSGTLAFVGRALWEDEGFIEADVYELKHK